MAGRAETLVDAVEVAEQSLDEGAARERLEAFIATTRRLGGPA